MKPYERRVKSLVQIEKPSFEITPEDSVFLVGSCFSQHLGQLFERYKQPVHIDPFGTLYDPFAIYTCLQRITTNHLITENELQKHNGIYFHWAFSHLYTSLDVADLIQQLNDRVSAAYKALKETKYLFITYGTATNYYHISTKTTVANCHKVPGDAFEMRVPSATALEEIMENTLALIKAFSPKIQVIMTVSPVRHLRQGLYLNNLSKGLLKAAMHKHVSQQACSYFPAFELVLDDLRDYAFFEEDGAHPNKKAIQYVWERLTDSYFSKELCILHSQLDKLLAMLNHKIRFPQHPESKVFIDKKYAFLQFLEHSYPGIDFTKEREQIAFT